jgi:adenosylmethionine-8-amino-7-oxononanoate aminotransferase
LILRPSKRRSAHAHRANGAVIARRRQFGLRPDLVTFGKAVISGYIPLSGVIVDDKIAGV